MHDQQPNLTERVPPRRNGKQHADQVSVSGGALTIPARNVGDP